MIPKLTDQGLLPPFDGEIYSRVDSPYPVDILELCRGFAFSEKRVQLLLNLIRFRRELVSRGLKSGFQWVAGSLLEDTQLRDQIEPNDIDVVTFMPLPDKNLEQNFTDFPAVIDNRASLRDFQLDHYLVLLDDRYADDPRKRLVDDTRYFCQLFSHTRQGLWKGLLEVSLFTPDTDRAAFEYLQSLTA